MSQHVGCHAGCHIGLPSVLTQGSHGAQGLWGHSTHTFCQEHAFSFFLFFLFFFFLPGEPILECGMLDARH